MNLAKIALSALLSATALAAAGDASAQGRLNLYCSVQEDWCQLMQTEFEKATGVRVAMTRKSSGETYAQIKAEKDNPRGDIWWGGTGDPHLQAAEENLTAAYESPRMKEMQDWSVQQWKTGKQRTVGIYAGALGFGFNTELLAKKNLPEPKCWADLVKPEYKGEVQVANPHSSGTSYTMVASLVQILGENGAFDYLRKLNTNVNQYTKSGAAPIVAAGRGETLIGIVFMHDAITQAVRNFPIKTV
ncbi:MAG: ABC transporter substrate-binding protein, partial [Alphaproteobacteria bacterium]